MKIRFIHIPLFVCTLVGASLLIAWADKPKLVPLAHGYATQGEHVLFEGSRIDRKGIWDFGRFRKTLRQLDLDMASNPDAATFEVLSVEYTKDQKMVYYRWISPGRWWVVELPDADPATFEVVEGNLGKDKASVWWYGAKLEGCDPATLQVVEKYHVWKDKAAVWYQHLKIVGADPGTFTHLDSAYYVDKDHAYWSNRQIVGADVATFKVLGGSFFAVDKAMVYLSGTPQPQLDPATTAYIFHDPYGYQILSDKDGVYVNGLKFVGAVASDFTMIDHRSARSKDMIFLVDRWHSTPVTLLKEAGELVATTVFYETKTQEPLATVRGVVGKKGMVKVTLSPPPGARKAKAVPKWQQKLFQREDLVNWMREAGAGLK